MKKKVLIILLLIMPILIQARKAGDVQISFFLSGGAAVAGGELPDKAGIADMLGLTTPNTAFKSESGEFGLAYGFGFGAIIFIDPTTALTLDVSYQSKSGAILYEKNTAPDNLELSLEAQFITISTTARKYISDYFFVGLGFFYGFKVDRWDAKFKMGDMKTTKEPPDIDTDDFGFQIDLGSSINLSTVFSMNILLRFQMGLDAYLGGEDDKDQFDMRSRAILLQLAINYKI